MTGGAGTANIGGIVGGVIGAVVGIIVMIIIVYFVVKGKGMTARSFVFLYCSLYDVIKQKLSGIQASKDFIEARPFWNHYEAWMAS